MVVVKMNLNAFHLLVPVLYYPPLTRKFYIVLEQARTIWEMCKISFLLWQKL